MAKPPAKAPAKPDRGKAKGKLPPARKMRAKPVVKKGEDIPPDQVDPAFLTHGEMLRRERFAQAYVIHGTLGRSAMDAGFECSNMNSATVVGHRVYHEPWVRQRIEEIQAQLLTKLAITQERVLKELGLIAFLDPGEVMDDAGVRALHDIPEDTRRVIASYKSKRRIIPGQDGDPDIEEEEREVRFVSKDAALDKLARYLAMYEKEKDDKGFSAEDFTRALGEGIARASNRAR